MGANYPPEAVSDAIRFLSRLRRGTHRVTGAAIAGALAPFVTPTGEIAPDVVGDISHAELADLTTGDPHTQYAETANNLLDLASTATARTNLGLNQLTIQEIDGTPAETEPTTLEFPNGTLTEPSAGVVRYTPTAVGTDELAKVSSNDTAAGYLNGKLVAGLNITLTETNDGGNETLEIAVSAGGGGHTIQDEGITVTQRTQLNFTGDSVAVSDDFPNDQTDVTINHLGTAVHTVAQPVRVRNNGSLVGVRPTINLIAGTNVTLTVTDDGVNDEVDVTIAASGGGASGQYRAMVYTLVAGPDFAFVIDEDGHPVTSLEDLE